MKRIPVWVYPIFVVIVLYNAWTAGQSGGTDTGASQSPTASLTPTASPVATPTPTKTKAEPLPYWPDGVVAEDITDASSRSCTFDLCVIVKLTATKNCSSITLDGSTYDAEDNYLDDVSTDYGRMKKGQVRIVEFGTDAIDNEDYMELDDQTCWK